MPPWRRNTSWASPGRRLCAGVVLLAYLATASGVPLPLVEDKDRSTPFPCMDHACGCRNAEECWRHCCCFTPEEKWAWARSRGIEPPAYAARPADSDRHDNSLCNLCESPTAEAAACPHCGQRKGACCAGKARQACCTTSQPTADSGSRSGTGGRGWVVGLTALRCHGQSTVWVATGSVIPPSPALVWSPHAPLDSTLSYSDHPPFALSLPPPDPPPRPRHA
jgi:hypothetical protein